MPTNQYVEFFVIFFALFYILSIRYSTYKIMPLVVKALSIKGFSDQVYSRYKFKILLHIIFSSVFLIFIATHAFFLMSSLQIGMSLSIGLCVFIGSYAINTIVFYVLYHSLYQEYVLLHPNRFPVSD